MWIWFDQTKNYGRAGFTGVESGELLLWWWNSSQTESTARHHCVRMSELPPDASVSLCGIRPHCLVSVQLVLVRAVR